MFWIPSYELLISNQLKCVISRFPILSWISTGTVWFSKTNKGVQAWCCVRRQIPFPALLLHSPLSQMTPQQQRCEVQDSGSDRMNFMGWRSSSFVCICYSKAHFKEWGLCISVASARILTLSLLMLAFPTQEIWSRCSSKFSATLGKSSVNLLSVTS